MGISTGVSLIAQLVKNLPAVQKTLVQFLGWEDCWRRNKLPTPVFLVFCCGSAGKDSACNAGDLGLIPDLGNSPGEGKRYPLQYSGIDSSMNCIVHGVTKSWKGLNDFYFTSLHALVQDYVFDSYPNPQVPPCGNPVSLAKNSWPKMPRLWMIED